MSRKGTRQNDLQRLLSRIVKCGENECWQWTGLIGTWGYGSFWLDGKTINASRAAYLLMVGGIPEGKVVCHSCDNPPCCNPAHLWLGSQGDNVRDCKTKGRSRGLFSERRGADHPRYVAKLTPEIVIEARRRYAAGESQTSLSKEFGVTSGTMSRAIRGIKWGYIK